MAKIIHLTEKWIVEWHEKLEGERFLKHREWFNSEKEAMVFAELLETPKEREKRGLPLTRKHPPTNTNKY